jgi:hypothetical protein
MAELSKVEQLAAANLNAVPENPCVVWDEIVARKMEQDGVARSAAVDRLLAGGFSDVWLKCCSWDAATAQSTAPQRSTSGIR